MKKKVWISLLLVAIVAVVAIIFFQNIFFGSSNDKETRGFSVVSLEGKDILLSDADVVSFNSTSQELTLTNLASERLANQTANLYNFNNIYLVSVKGQEIYRGIFRSAIMSALPAPPQIAILYPSFDFSTDIENDHAIRLFYPNFEAPSYLTEMNAKLVQYFQDTGKLVN